MAQMPRTLRNYNVFINGQGYAGIASEIDLDKIALKVEKIRAGGLGGGRPVPMGMLEDITLKIKFIGREARMMSLMGREDVSIQCRESLSDGANAIPGILDVTGLFSEYNPGATKEGDVETEITVHPVFSKLTLDGANVFEFDLDKPSFIPGDGEDLFAQDRVNIGA